MSTLTEFLLARIAEDEYAIIARRDFDPERVLADCGAKRGIIEELGGALEPDAGSLTWGEGGWYHAENSLALMASVYSDHPDYRDEWS